MILIMIKIKIKIKIKIDKPYKYYSQTKSHIWKGKTFNYLFMHAIFFFMGIHSSRYSFGCPIMHPVLIFCCFSEVFIKELRSFIGILSSSLKKIGFVPLVFYSPRPLMGSFVWTKPFSNFSFSCFRCS